MSKDETIEMAKQTGLWFVTNREDLLIDFAKLVAEAKCKELANQIEKMPFGDTSLSFAAWIREQA